MKKEQIICHDKFQIALNRQTDITRDIHIFSLVTIFFLVKRIVSSIINKWVSKIFAVYSQPDRRKLFFYIGPLNKSDCNQHACIWRTYNVFYLLVSFWLNRLGHFLLIALRWFDFAMILCIFHMHVYRNKWDEYKWVVSGMSVQHES